ncbi:MAG: hypothetical protein HC802_04280 [Caldilineaceae bacterium]|nr:hypothetical protein [Caldilineaceae bacterium]
MRTLTRRSLLYTLAVALLAHLLILLPLFDLIQAVAVLLLAGLIPGILLVDLLVGQGAAPPTFWERILYSVGAGYALLVAVMLLVSYLPGGATTGLTLLAFDAVTLLLAGLLWWRMGRGVSRGSGNA